MDVCWDEVTGSLALVVLLKNKKVLDSPGVRRVKTLDFSLGLKSGIKTLSPTVSPTVSPTHRFVVCKC